jgi:hypothetical protein
MLKQCKITLLKLLKFQIIHTDFKPQILIILTVLHTTLLTFNVISVLVGIK